MLPAQEYGRVLAPHSNFTMFYKFLQFFTIFYNFLQFFTIFYNFLQFFTIFYNFLQFFTKCYNFLPNFTFFYVQLLFNFHYCIAEFVVFAYSSIHR